MGIWDPIAARLSVSTQDGEVRRPTPEDLDRYETEAGFKLPDDYRDYALTFGPGDLSRDQFNFRTPGFPGIAWADLAECNRQWKRIASINERDDADLADAFGDADRARRFVLFSSVVGIGDEFAWDPADVTDPDRHDYGIYILASETNNPPVERVARTFREFVMDYVLGRGYRRHVYNEQSPDTSNRDGSGPIGFAQASVEPRE